MIKNFSLKNVTEKLTEKEYIIYVTKLASNLKYIKNKTKRICEAALRKNGVALEYIDESLQTRELCLLAVSNNGLALKFALYKDREICITAIRNNPKAIKFVGIHTKEICLETVKGLGSLIRYCKYIDKDVIMAAVMQDGMVIQYIPEIIRDEDICYEAVKQNGLALAYISKKYRTKNIYKIALLSNGNALKYIDAEDQDTIMCYIALSSKYNSIRYIQEQNELLALVARIMNTKTMRYIDKEYRHGSYIQKLNTLSPNDFENLRNIILMYSHVIVMKTGDSNFDYTETLSYIKEKIDYCYSPRDLGENQSKTSGGSI